MREAAFIRRGPRVREREHRPRRRLGRLVTPHLRTGPPLNCTLLLLLLLLHQRLVPCHSFVHVNSNEKSNERSNVEDGGSHTNVDEEDDYEDDFFPLLIDADDISHFFSTYDLDGLHWGLTNIFRRSARNPDNNNSPGSKKKELPQALVARGGGDTYTSEYKLSHDLEQARYLARELERSDPETSEYFASRVVPIYEGVLQNIPPLSRLERTKGLYAFTEADYAMGIGSVYNKALYVTTADELDPGWRESESTNTNGLLNDALDWDGIQRDWLGENHVDDTSEETTSSQSIPGVIVIDDLLSPRALSLLRRLLLCNTHWFQTKTPLEFGKYVGAYVDDGLHDPAFLELARQLHQSMPQIMGGHPLRYMWAYKYDSEWESGINLHADQAAVNVNIWLSTEDADLQEEGYGGGLVVYTAKPPSHWDFESYNTNTDFVVEKLLRPTDFANVTVQHRPNRAVIFDSALFHQTDRYRFRKGYANGRINLTLLFGDMQKGESSTRGTQAADGARQEL